MVKRPRSRSSDRILYDDGNKKVVEVDRIMPDGKKARKTIFRMGEAVVVIPLLKNGDVLVEKHYRIGADTWIYEFPAGRLKPKELPDDAARRELGEEIGFQVDELRELTSILVLPGMSDYVTHVFIATGSVVKKPQLEEDEYIETKEMSIQDMLDLARDGELEDAKTLVALLYFSAFKRAILGKK